MNKEEVLKQLLLEGFSVEIRDNVLTLQPGGDVTRFVNRLQELNYQRSYGYFGELPESIESLDNFSESCYNMDE